MALPEGYYSEEDNSESEGLSFPDNSSCVKNKITVDESKLHAGQKLINAVLDRKVDEMKNLIEHGSDMNYIEEHSGWTPLMHAASLGISEYVELLLKNGASPNLHDKLTTPLICLCESTSFNQDELLKCFTLLIDAGANINDCDENNISPLMHATSRGHLPLVARLLELGVDLEMRDNDGWTAIFFAVNSGDANMVQMFKDSGANISLTDNKGRTLNDLAIKDANKIIAEIVSIKKKMSPDDILQQLIQNKNMSENNSIMCDMPNYTLSDFNGFSIDVIKTLVATGLTNLVSLFLEKDIGYGQFLTFKEQDWEKIGVPMSFDRKKLTFFSKRIIQSEWSQEAFIKKIDEEFSLFKLIQSIVNAVRIIHILIATCCVCRRELHILQPELGINIKELLKQCLQELFEYRVIIKKVYSLVEEIDKSPPADFIGPCKTNN